MAESQVVRTARDSATIVSDDGGVNTYGVACEPGDFNYSAPGTSVLRILGRGKHKTERKNEDQVTTLGWSVHMRDISSTTDAVLPDICEIDRAGTFVKNNWVSTRTGISDVFTVDVEHIIGGAAFGEADKSLFFDDMKLTGTFAEGFPTAYTVAGEASILAPVIS